MLYRYYPDGEVKAWNEGDIIEVYILIQSQFYKCYNTVTNFTLAVGIFGNDSTLEFFWYRHNFLKKYWNWVIYKRKWCKNLFTLVPTPKDTSDFPVMETIISLSNLLKRYKSLALATVISKKATSFPNMFLVNLKWNYSKVCNFFVTYICSYQKLQYYWLDVMSSWNSRCL